MCNQLVQHLFWKGNQTGLYSLLWLVFSIRDIIIKIQYLLKQIQHHLTLHLLIPTHSNRSLTTGQCYLTNIHSRLQSQQLIDFECLLELLEKRDQILANNRHHVILERVTHAPIAYITHIAVNYFDILDKGFEEHDFEIV